MPDSDFWHEVRPHDDECEKARITAKMANLPYPPCTPGCRVGQPWPTVRLLPSDREKARKLREQMNRPREIQPREDERAR